jgi:hypothetical protein
LRGGDDVNTQANAGVKTGKKVSILLLYATSAVIAIMGIVFCGYSLLNNLQITVMQSSVPGAVFGVVVAFLGIRYFLAVGKLRAEVYKPISRFSWSNFKHH